MGNIVVRFMNYMFPSDEIIYSNDLKKPINIKDNCDIYKENIIDYKENIIDYKENIIDYKENDEDNNDVFII